MSSASIATDNLDDLVSQLIDNDELDDNLRQRLWKHLDQKEQDAEEIKFDSATTVVLEEPATSTGPPDEDDWQEVEVAEPVAVVSHIPRSDSIPPLEPDPIVRQQQQHWIDRNAEQKKRQELFEAQRAQRIAEEYYQRANEAKRSIEPIRQAVENSKGDNNIGNKVVFIDLEWHQLNQKQPIDMTDLEKGQFLRSNIAQICAISANYRIRFNQYVSYKPLHPNWKSLVNWGYVGVSKQDDPNIAMPLEQCMEQFINTFGNDTLFVHYGATDGKAIFRSLSAIYDVDADDNTVKIPESIRTIRTGLIERMKNRNYRWANIQHWMKQHAEFFDVHAKVKIAGSLSTLYDALYHKPLLLYHGKLDAGPTLLDNLGTMTKLKERIKSFPESLQSEDQYGLVPKQWLRVEYESYVDPAEPKNMFPSFWHTSHLEPVWHVAHTDTVMMINCVAIIAMFDDEWVEEADKLRENASSLSTEKLNPENASVKKGSTSSALSELATCIITTTGFFRQTQLALSETTAQSIYEFYTSSKKAKSQTVEYLASGGLKWAASRTMATSKWKQPPPASTSAMVTRSKAKLLTKAEVESEVKFLEKELSQDDEDAFARNWYMAAADTSNTIYYEVADQRHILTLGATRLSGRYEDKVKAIRTYLQSDKFLSHDAELRDSLIQTKHPFSYRRKARFPQDADVDYSQRPWFTAVSISKVNPRTEILHTKECIVFSDPKDPSKTRNFAELNMMLYDFDLLADARLPVNAQFQFCKQCKKYSNDPWPDRRPTPWQDEQHTPVARHHSTSSTSSSTLPHSLTRHSSKSLKSVAVSEASDLIPLADPPLTPIVSYCAMI